MRLKVEKSIRSLESFDSGDSRMGHVDVSLLGVNGFA